MVQKSYAKVGGNKGAGFTSPEDMVKNIPFWKICLRAGKPIAGLFYKFKSGRKTVALFTDGTPDGKFMLANMFATDFLKGRAYCEVSHATLDFVQKILGKDTFNKVSIPVEEVKLLLQDDEIILIDKFEYQRKIGGEWVNKCMVGSAELPF